MGKYPFLLDSPLEAYLALGYSEEEAIRMNDAWWDYYSHIPTIEHDKPKRHHFTQIEKAEIWDKTGGKCYYCEKPINPFRDFTVDHVEPVSKGGTDTMDNYVPCCRRCNLSKGARLLPKKAVGHR